MTLLIGRNNFTLADLRLVQRAGVAAVERIVESGTPTCGINTGFGKLSHAADLLPSLAP
jgi:histidine ammonia-lyase